MYFLFWAHHYGQSFYDETLCDDYNLHVYDYALNQFQGVDRDVKYILKNLYLFSSCTSVTT